MILRNVQRTSFPEDVLGLSGKLSIQSRFAALQAYVENGCLRVGGRLQRSCLSHEEKHPYILPGKHPVTDLIIRHYHHENGHVGTHQVLAASREKFWILKGVSSVQAYLGKCHTCKRASSKFGEQITSPLPDVRCITDKHKLIHPFAACGIDYFGRLNVKLGRSVVKRYGCLIACLRFRAVHIEMAADLSILTAS